MSTATSAPVTLGGKKLNISNLGKVLYPETGFTKGEVIDYYLRIAPFILPHLRDRSLTLKRYPNGVNDQHFYEKNCPEYRPDWIKTAAVPTVKGGNIEYCMVQDRPSLIWVANLASIELHTSLAKAKHPDRPTAMVFDLDPGAPATIVNCCRIALHLRTLLEKLNLESFAKTSGGKGLHLYVPLNTPSATFDATKELSYTLSSMLQLRFPDEVTATMAKALRPGKVYVDWAQNDRSKTTACAYSLRARPHPTVSTPVTWDDVEQTSGACEPSALTFETDQSLQRNADYGDLFAPVLTLKQRLPKL